MTKPTNSDAYGFRGSLVSYPDRGPDGRSDYRGNTTGYIVRDFLGTYHTDRAALFVDPMEGSGTSGDAARALSIPYQGFDLRDGFDAVKDDLLSRLAEPAGSAFLHPAYAGMIEYSGNMWGDSPHPADLSQQGDDVDAFADMLQAVLQNTYHALRPGGYYGVLLGNWRSHGVYHHLPSKVLSLAPGTLVDEIVKVQHNVTSTRTQYRRTNFVRIQHETLLVFRRETDGSIFAMTSQTLAALRRFEVGTWRNLVLGATRGRETFSLGELYAAFREHPKARSNRHPEAKLRQVVQDERFFERVSVGQYRVL